MKHLLVCSVSIMLGLSCSENTNYANWNNYGGNKENNHYSALKQVDTNNVQLLKPIWEFHTGDADNGTQIQVNPIVVDDIFYGVSPKLKLFALEAASGKKLWIFDPSDNSNQDVKGAGYFSINVCRGVTYYTDGKNKKCIFYSAGSSLFSIDAKTGKPIALFGDNGRIDLHNDLGKNVQDLYVSSTTPGIIFKDLIIIGTRVSEDASAAPGHIRAYDVNTGKLRWIFHTIPQPGEAGYDSWEDKNAYQYIGGANAWSGFSLDALNGIVYAPIGSASFDFYGGKRKGANLFANSLVALNAETGKRIWHYQTVHHDIWDRDLPTAPVLLDVNHNGKKIPAVAQPTKSGFVFLFNRLTGQPLFPIHETKVPDQSELLGEKPFATQPIPVLPKPFVRQTLTEKDLNPLVSTEEFKLLKKQLSNYNTGNMFNPPSKKGTVIFPGYDGGAEWGGAGVNPNTGIIYINASEMPWILTMVPQQKKHSIETNEQAAKRLYASNCMGCHGSDLKGTGNFPSLIGIEKKYSSKSFNELLYTGRRMMPAMNQLDSQEKKAIMFYILGLKHEWAKKFEGKLQTKDERTQMPYTSTGYNKFLTKEGYPAISPPWGTLNAIDLNTGALVWKTTLGDYPELKAKGIHSGTENYGGPIVTAGGLVIIAATSDEKIRAFNQFTGKLLWEYHLPAAGFATPAVYQVKGKQYISIACGGGKLGKKSGDCYLTFALQ